MAENLALNLGNSLKNLNNSQHLLHHINLDSVHSDESEPSRSSSAVTSGGGSAGSSQPGSLIDQHQHKAHDYKTKRGLYQVQSGHISSSNCANLNDQASLVDRRASLHETLVRSLLQFKQQQQHQPDELLSSLQTHRQHNNHNNDHNHNPRSLLESLASLSSVGTGSVLDPVSNSPTERTATPPSGPLSPLGANKSTMDGTHYEALNLAKPSAFDKRNMTLSNEVDEYNGDDEINIVEDDNENDKKAEKSVNGVESPLDGAKKVRQFLENQMTGRDGHDSFDVKFESNNNDHEDDDNGDGDDEDGGDDDGGDASNIRDSVEPPRKRAKLEFPADEIDKPERLLSISKSLILKICNRRGGGSLNDDALDEAARYTECFIEVLLNDAALIAGHSVNPKGEANEDNGHYAQDNYGKKSSFGSEDGKKESSLIDTSSLSLALKLIPSKLLNAVQQQV